MPALYTRRSFFKHAATWAVGAGLLALDPLGFLSGRGEAAAARPRRAPTVYGWFPS